MHRAAEIIFGENGQPIRCRISDMSDSGARLALAFPVAHIPRTFTLVLFKDASVRRDCELVWTDRRYIGIKFLSRWY
jgi:PilZ domain